MTPETSVLLKGLIENSPIAVALILLVILFLRHLKEVRDAEDAHDLPPLERELTFENISFSYDGETTVLKELSLDVPKGSIMALVGPSGAGKSTLVSLIPRFYDPPAGRILVDGHDLRSVRIRSLRKQIGLVPQETLLFNDTVSANMTCGEDSLPLPDVLSLLNHVLER